MFKSNHFFCLLKIFTFLSLAILFSGCSEEQKKAMKGKLKAELDEAPAAEIDKNAEEAEEPVASPIQKMEEKIEALKTELKAKEAELKEAKAGFKGTREGATDVSLNMTANMDARKALRQKTIALNKEIPALKRKIKNAVTKLKKLKKQETKKKSKGKKKSKKKKK